MARRRQVSYFSRGSEWFHQALGFTHSGNSLRDLHASLEVQLDFDRVEHCSGYTISHDAKVEILDHVRTILAWDSLVTHDDANNELDVALVSPSGSTPTSEFTSLIERIEKQASELQRLVDELVEIEPELASRPSRTDLGRIGDVGIRAIIERITSSEPSWHEQSELDFSDYFSFRRTLDYLSRFTSANKQFNNYYGYRTQSEPDHSLMEVLIRRVMASLRETDFPMGITIPTDTNLEYQSPLIAMLLEIQSQVLEMRSQLPLNELNRAEPMNYRQVALVASKVRKGFERIDEVHAKLMRQYR